MEKVVCEGNVAVLYSPGYGLGWYTVHSNEELVFHPKIVELVETKRHELITEDLICDLLNISADSDGLPYLGGASQLCIKWLPIGTEFRIEEYDGAEQVLTLEQLTWLIA